MTELARLALEIRRAIKSDHRDPTDQLNHACVLAAQWKLEVERKAGLGPFPERKPVDKSLYS